MPRKKTNEPVFDRDNPEWTEKDFARAKPAGQVLPKSVLSQFKASRGRPRLDSPKKSVKLRLDADVLDAYRNAGTGWQTRINTDLRKARKLKAG